MGKYIVCVITSILIGSGLIFADIEHKVARGETIESIAEKYGISKDELLEVNKDAISLFYIGQILIIPGVQMEEEQDDLINTINRNVTISPMERGLAVDAKRYFENKEWGKAAKTYSKLIKDYPKSVYYYNRALSHFNDNKNRQAANDFETALSMDDCTPSMLENGPELLAEARRRHSEWMDSQLNTVGNIFLGAVTVGLTAWATVESAKLESTTGAYMTADASSSSSDYESSSDYDREDVTPTTKKKQKCGFCGGKGSVVKYVANFGINPGEWCDECGKKVTSGHYHETCTHCHGTGER